jgi:ParB family chromosome partitioning protein
MAKGFYAAFSEQMDRLQSSVENIYKGPGADGIRQKTMSLPIESLSPGSFQPRRSFAAAELEELADSIRQQGLIQPIVVRPKDGDTYEILAGERRWRACKLVGMASIESIVRDVDDQAALAMSLIENIQRENLNPIEVAEAYRGLIDRFGLSQTELATLVGRDRSSIANLEAALPDRLAQ